MTLGFARLTVKEMLEAAGIEDSLYEAEQLIAQICGVSLATIKLNGNQEISQKNEKKLLKLASLRANHYPLQYILGEWEFYSLPFKVTEDVLIPRADTELLVDTALSFIGTAEGLDIIDLCAGSGCVGISIAANTKNCNITAAEKFPEAFKVLKQNIKLNGVEVTPLLCDVKTQHSGSYDLIVSNPPYIKADVIPTLSKEVLHEPKAALDGGGDGLDFYRAICKHWVPHLKPQGALMLEIGYDQKADVMALLKASGLENIECKTDINGCDRVIIGTLPL